MKYINYYRNLFSLEGKVSLVTGAAGHLGSEISKGLASYGSTTILLGRTESKLSKFCDKYNKKFENKFIYYVCDVTDEKQFSKVIEDVKIKYGSVDVLVNNAFNEQRKTIEKITKQDWDRGIDNILSSVFFCSQTVIPHMLDAGSGSIINIASIYGFLGTDQSIFQEVKSPSIFYSTAKGGIIQMTKRLATEYASAGIRVNCVSPGAFPKKTEGVPENINYIIDLSEKSPMKRIGQPAELVGIIIYLSSQASSYMTGQNLIVDGGWSIW